MLFWALAGALTALVLLVLVRPLLRDRPAAGERCAGELRLYRDQLAELERDRERGVLGEREAKAARLEIERRLLAVGGPADVAAETEARPSPRVLPALVLLLVPALALGLYVTLGEPDLPDHPHPPPPAKSKDAPDLESIRSQLQARLAKEPESLEGWIYLAETEAALGRFPDAKAALRKALALSDRRAEVLEAYGTLLTEEAQGEITPEAEAAFAEAIKKRPDAIRSRYELGIAKAQRGDLAGALELWRALEKEAPADAPWLATVRQSIASAERDRASGGQAPAGAPPSEVAGMLGLPAGERESAIRAMVAGLAQRLAEHPDDPAGWKRLGRSYLVLGQASDAVAAYRKAATEAPADADAAVGLAEALASVRGETATLTPEEVEAWKQVAKLAPEQPEALWNLGLAAEQRGDPAEAARLWRRLLAQEGIDETQRATITKALDGLPAAR
jgi:cytochrome c-type biogenesis protein CcmH